jgi:hypothetical protein
MNLLRAASALSASLIASFSMIMAADQASASTLLVSSTSVVYPSSPAVTASIHLTSPSIDYSSVYVSPQYLNGTLDGHAVSLFAYCVDILNSSGPGTFDVVSLLDYLGGNTVKYNQLAALIAANGGPAGKYADATTQAAVWEAIYDNNPYNAAGGNFWMNNVHNDPTLIADANAMLAQAVSNAGITGSNLQLFVARNSVRQDMLFWTTSAVPEPATWAMMLLGFGAIGFQMRRRQSAPLPQLA